MGEPNHPARFKKGAHMDLGSKIFKISRYLDLNKEKSDRVVLYNKVKEIQVDCDKLKKEFRSKEYLLELKQYNTLLKEERVRTKIANRAARIKRVVSARTARHKYRNKINLNR